MEYAIPSKCGRDAINTSCSVSTIPRDWWLAEEGKVGREFLLRPPERRRRLSNAPLQGRCPWLADLEMLLIGDLRFPPESIKHLQAQRGTLARESAIPPVFNEKPTCKPRASNEGTQFPGNSWRGLDAKVEVVTR